MEVVLHDNFVADMVEATDFGLVVIKNREVGKTNKGSDKTTFRCIEIQLVDEEVKFNTLKPVLESFFKHFSKSLGKVYANYGDFEQCVLSGMRCTVMPDIKAESFFDDSFNRVVGFFEHLNQKVA